jgi:ATP-dependent DNA helicase RecQ
LAQKEAAWLAQTAPPRSTTLIALPTGAGKSLCFQLLPLFGTGLTVVVVPTVALALDQWRQARTAFKDAPSLQPVCYVADENADAMLAQVRSRAARMVFTSPEACVSGRLRKVLDDAVKDGWFENLVIDEAHIIETWGNYFRVDFQLLSMLWQRWMERPDCRLRTHLLSATFTESGARLLQQMFCRDEKDWRVHVSQRLRPEMTYFRRSFPDEPAREQAVLECVWALPRPAILYTTEVEEANRWAQLLREQGFQRVSAFHGETPSAQRRQSLDDWREDRIDLMVASSAFGLGVDKPDVRAVVHACLPENLHRYYQEVGRGGRDGYSSICMLLTAPRDLKVARTLTPKLMRPENVQARWEGLWDTRQVVSEDDHRYELRIDAKPLRLLGEHTFSEHVRWNKRLLLQLRRARQLELCDQRREVGDEDAREWLEVRLNFPPQARDVGERIADVRDRELKELRDGLAHMIEFLRGDECVGRILRRVYGRDITQYTCGGCPACRRSEMEFFCPTLRVQPPEWNASPLAPLVVTGVPDYTGNKSRWVRAFREWVQRHRLRRFVCALDHHELVLDLCAKADPEGRLTYRIDPLDMIRDCRIERDESVVILHAGELLRSAFDLRLGQRVIHLIGANVRHLLDAHGRRPLEAEGGPLVTYEAWNDVH